MNNVIDRLNSLRPLFAILTKIANLEWIDKQYRKEDDERGVVKKSPVWNFNEAVRRYEEKLDHEKYMSGTHAVTAVLFAILVVASLFFATRGPRPSSFDTSIFLLAYAGVAVGLIGCVYSIMGSVQVGEDYKEMLPGFVNEIWKTQDFADKLVDLVCWTRGQPPKLESAVGFLSCDSCTFYADVVNVSAVGAVPPHLKEYFGRLVYEAAKDIKTYQSFLEQGFHHIKTPSEVQELKAKLKVRYDFIWSLGVTIDDLEKIYTNAGKAVSEEMAGSSRPTELVAS